MADLKLSVLDQSPVSSGSTPADALQNTIDLARNADALGFHRYWIAEHHAMDVLASPAPELLLARVGSETSRIRLGSGGIMLPHYSAFKVAETFRVLHALYPGRIDLGIGRAPGGSPLESYALRRNRKEPLDDFPEQLTELLAFLHKDFPAEHRFSKIHLSPDMPGTPEVWLLGSSLWSAEAAAQFGLPYNFAHFIDPNRTREAITAYRESFRPSDFGSYPQAMLAMGVICAETESEAERLASSARLLFRRIRQGDLRTVAPPEEAVAELATIPEAVFRQWFPEGEEWPRYAVGTPSSVRRQLTAMAEALGIDEIMVVTIVHDHNARVRSYELLAEAFDLEGEMLSATRQAV
ncbi:Bacterial luciferase-like monooxygenase [Acidisarcina polymorpha]|uniref:Luciferase-like monooxygenase n=1 Tax=Acidisarcina polymorpha TaxID=2211140 RepID=A0A2Z5G700_9BACT|nr:LLM class flavin-dependent oxidoreductase [Acidisarcina polymorpha]AXC14474.1 Bacterial luciferase-like monooxygenase [Acidisarcina polymorpha]